MFVIWAEIKLDGEAVAAELVAAGTMPSPVRITSHSFPGGCSTVNLGFARRWQLKTSGTCLNLDIKAGVVLQI